jgi:hypothetical protein
MIEAAVLIALTAQASLTARAGHTAPERPSALTAAELAAGEWQWSVPVPAREGAPEAGSHAYLWIPPTAGRVRGVVVGGMTLMEMDLLTDPAIRAAAADEGLALVFFHPHFDALFDHRNKGADRRFLASLAALAEASGYAELARVPWITVGHSTGAIFARNVGYWRPERTAGIVHLKAGRIGQHLMRDDASLAGIPLLAVVGEHEEFGPGENGTIPPGQTLEVQWRTVREKLLALRAQDPRHLVTLVVEPGAGHFAWSEPLARQVALFLRKVAERRLARADGHLGARAQPRTTRDAASAAPEVVRPIPPESGWLTDGDLRAPKPRPPAPYRAYRGDRAAAFWAFDRAHAEAVTELHRGLGRPDQFLSFVHEGKVIPPKARLSQPFVPLPDPSGGSPSFRVEARLLDRVPDFHPAAGQPVGQAPGGVTYRVIRGAAAQVGPDTFAIRPRTFGLDRHTSRVLLLARHPGDARHRATEQPIEIRLPEALTEGAAQTIEFPPLPDLDGRGATARDGRVVPLAARADSGLPVGYHVARGPAVIEGTTLRLLRLPPRARLPVTVTVVAWQLGRASPPRVRSATPIERTFLLTGPRTAPGTEPRAGPLPEGRSTGK